MLSRCCNRKHIRCPSQLAAGRMVSAGALLALLAGSCLSAQTAPADLVLNWMNTIAQQELQQRAEAIGAIHTIAQADHRKQVVQAELLRDLGGLPDYSGPLNPEVTGQIRTDSYTIEKVIYRSLPGF